MLRGHYREAINEGELALSVATSGGYDGAVGEVLNTLGMARIALGEVAGRGAQLRQAMEVSSARSATARASAPLTATWPTF